MSGRPPSSAGASRPFTASAFRPSSARPSTSAGAFDCDRQYTYGDAYIEEEEEESDTEDLFAFLPPSTTDQQRDADNQRAFEFPPAAPVYGQVFANAVPSDHPPLSYPSPTFDPYARFPSEVAGPSRPFPVPVSQIPVESPPSTASNHGASDPYRMRRLSTALTGTTGTHPSRTSALSSREIRVSLPSGLPEKMVEDLHYQRIRHPSSTLGDTVTLSITPSMLEDSHDGSIKWVPSLFARNISILVRLYRMEFDFDAVNEEDSPFPEVRASVSNIDDQEMPAMTFRMWLIGLVLCMTAG